MENTIPKDVTIWLIGEPSSGKTCLKNALLDFPLSKQYYTTVMAKMESKIFDYDNSMFNLHFVDLPGTKRFFEIAMESCCPADLFIFTTNSKDINSNFSILREYYDFMENHLISKTLPVIIAVTKSEPNESQIDVEKVPNKENKKHKMSKLNVKSQIYVNSSLKYNLEKLLDAIFTEICFKDIDVEINTDKQNNESSRSGGIHGICCSIM
eukprot:TRINITY_DN1904_c0_g1_i1.p1 TRINITY_DN1904_c0_g1~~TRINITY_DN1904_c0_g1_i1.p1  ORF type:complete len:221 (-),score=54.64 TRINITY_DN1904_c0_g1_i1:460-1089(-)